MAEHGLDGDVAEVFILGNEQHGQRVSIEPQHFCVADKAQKTNAWIVAGQLAKISFVLSRAGDQQRNIAGKILHGADGEVDSLPAMQTARQQEMLLSGAILALGKDGRIQHLGVESVVELQAAGGFLAVGKDFADSTKSKAVETLNGLTLTLTLRQMRDQAASHIRHRSDHRRP